MVKEGYYFGIPPLLLGVIFFLLHWTVAAVILALLGLFCFSFFRDPERVIPADPGAIISPADGRVVVITDEAHAGVSGKRISIFLAVWNVHVNRSPASGVITRLDYQPGKFLAAMRADASAQNEQNIFTLASEHGEIVFKQIAGYIARRVIAWKKIGDTVARGERVGLVRFGSRADVWLPTSANIVVKIGDHVAGGSSILAFLPVKSMGLSSGQDASHADASGHQQDSNIGTAVPKLANANLISAGQPKP
jgi:phosphatidylserine decarboxylase